MKNVRRTIFFSILQLSVKVVFINSRSLSVSPQISNPSNGNREKFTIDLSKDKDYDHPLKKDIARRFRRYIDENVPSITQYSFNDSHYIAEVHWSGSNSSSIMVLMKDPSSIMSPSKPSSFWVSRDYGNSFEDISDKFTLPNGTRAVITEFYSSKANNKYYILADKFNKYVFSSSDECKTFLKVKVYFHPVELNYHPKYATYIIGYEKDMDAKQLYTTTNNGKTWEYKSTNVRSYYWGYAPPYDLFSNIYYMRKSWFGSGNILKKASPWSFYYSSVLAYDIEDFELVNQYMFVTKNSTTHPGTKDLLVSYYRGDFQNTSFPMKNNGTSYIIADAHENETMVAVNHNGTANLYISNREGTKYSLSLGNILYFNKNEGDLPYFEHSFVDLHRIKGISGIYIATALTDGAIGTRHLQSYITFNKGGFWSLVRPPSDTKNCSIWRGCSLHISQEFGYHNPLLNFSPILSKESAPGFLIGTGNTGDSLKSKPNVYMSRDAGLSWKKVLEGHYYYNMLDHGGIIVAVEKFSLTETISYSYDEGKTWHSEVFSKDRVRVYGVLTEPGEKSLIVTIYASYNKAHAWEVFQIDMKRVLGKKCSKDSDYNVWTVADQRNDTERCVLGKKQIFERRKAKSRCYNGYDYDRPINVSACLCSREDYQCDYGFKEKMILWFRWDCVHDSNFEDYSKKPPSWCKPGLSYNISSGYVKAPGDACYGGDESKYVSTRKMCPIPKVDDYLLYATRKSFFGYDFESKKSIEFKIDGYSNIVALEVAYDDGVLFFADKDRDVIVKIDSSSGNITTLIGFNESVTHIESMSYDWISGNLYYCDSGNSMIGIINLKGKHKKEIISFPTEDNPRAMLVHPTKGYLFWTDWGAKPKIGRATMNGENMRTIIDTKIFWPNGLTIDYDSNVLYFADANTDRIEACGLNGENRREILSTGVYHPYAITIYNDRLYWDDWNQHSIFSVDLQGNGKETVANYLAYAMDIKAFSKTRQKKGKNGCTPTNAKDKCLFICLPLENGKHECACPDNLIKDGNTCKCPNNEILHNGECKPKPGTTCLPTQFACLSGECIPKHWKCDQENDCSDGSDEAARVCSSCPSNNFRCSDGRCILDAYRCDGEFDCSDKSDETNCTAPTTSTCPSTKLECPNGRCINKAWLCDGDNDCQDLWDENPKNCPNTTAPTTLAPTFAPCLAGKFQCKANGRCIPEFWRCDNIDDCADHSDENNCDSKKCLPNEKSCDGNATCYLPFMVCNGLADCFDGTDEQGCATVTPATTKVLHCDDDHKYCADNLECYPKEGRCDNSFDCRDKSDEKDCGAITTDKPICFDFQCRSGKKECISNDKKCDGRADCKDGEDELNCRKSDCLPYPFGFNCTKVKEQCYLHNIVCDGTTDCRDETDEDKEICGVTKRIKNLRLKLDDMESEGMQVRLFWNAPDVSLSKVNGYAISYIDDHFVQKNIVAPLSPSRITIPNLKRCTKYVFAVAVNHTDLKSNKFLYQSTREIETPGRRYPNPPTLISTHGNKVLWQEDFGDCIDHYDIYNRVLGCMEMDSKKMVNTRLKSPNVLFDIEKVLVGDSNETKSYNCSVYINYVRKSDGTPYKLQTDYFSYPHSHIHHHNTAAMKGGKGKRNALIWAVPVAVVVIVLCLGLLLMVYKYRRLQNSFLAFAARGSYNRQVDDLDDEDDDNMAVAFHTGEDSPMINRFSDDEPLVVA